MAIRNGPRIRTRDSRTIEHDFHRRHTSDLHETGEFKGGEAEKLLTTPRPLTTYHPRKHLTNRDENLVYSASERASVPRVKQSKRQQTRRTNAVNDEGETEIVRKGEYTTVVCN